MGDRGIPKVNALYQLATPQTNENQGYRFMHGYSGHTFKLVNKNGDWVYTQIHMKSMQGTDFVTQEDSADYSPDFSQKDLYEAIQNGDYPKWTFEVQ